MLGDFGLEPYDSHFTYDYNKPLVEVTYDKSFMI